MIVLRVYKLGATKMKMRAGLLGTCAATALIIGLGFASPALAADTMPTKAPAAVEPLPFWWYEGFAEIGGRFFLNNPDHSSLGSFYKYRDLRPGVFGNFFFGAHHTGVDPLDIEVWGKNIGWDDQAFGLDLSKPGSYYLTLGWDETPHVYTDNAHSIWSGVGGTFLTPNVFLPQLTVGNGATLANTIANNSNLIDIKTRRDTASAGFRWTPNDNWDVNMGYSHLHREGTQAGGAVSFSGSGATRSTFEIVKPVDDVTQNADLKAEYAGSAPWGKPFNIALGGGYSKYSNSDDSVTFQNPWNPVNTANRPLNNLYSLPPDNQAGTVNVTGGVGLPFNSRYMGTFQYTNMRSDASNLPFSSNPLVTVPGVSTPDRETSTTLFNNVLNTQITSELNSTLKYRYYNYSAEANPAIIFAPRAPNPNSMTGFPDEEAAFRQPSSYTKQNADAELVWRPQKWLNLGASYDWEHWDRSFRNVATTNENTGKVFLDSKWGFSQLHASLQFGERRNDGYINFDGVNIDQYRMNDLADRNRTKGLITWAVDVTNWLTVTPNGGFLNDDYQTNVNFAPGSELGLKQANSWNAGIDGTINVNRDLAFFVAYNFEHGYRQVYENASPPKANVESTDLDNTIIVGAKYTAIPQKLFFNANFTYTRSISQWDLGCTPAGCQYSPLAVYPDVHNTLTELGSTYRRNMCLTTRSRATGVCSQGPTPT